MHSPQTMNSTDRTPGLQDPTAIRMSSALGRIALVAVLAGFALVDFATQNRMASDQSAAALAGTIAISAPGAGNDLAGQLVPSATEYYFPAQYMNQARSNDGNVMTYDNG